MGNTVEKMGPFAAGTTHCLSPPQTFGVLPALREVVFQPVGPEPLAVDRPFHISCIPDIYVQIHNSSIIMVMKWQQK